MAALPYMQLYVADYLADTAHLSALEHGAYLLLMFNYWQRGESFKAKDEQTLNKRLASVARMSNDEWESVRETLAEFFVVTETEWSHSRIDRDLEAVNTKSEKAKAAGKASAASRSNKRSTNSKQTLNHTDTETDTEQKNEDAIASSAPSRKIKLDANGIWTGVSTVQRSAWSTAYPALSLDAELAKAAAWIIANPKNKKSNYARFLTNWLARAQDRARPVEKPGAMRHGNFAGQDYRSGIGPDGSF